MVKVRKAVILAAGLGTRLLPYSKETPKEMLPISVEENRVLVLKPVLQVIFEQLYDAGVREFCFIVGRNKRLIENHFTPDNGFIEYLYKKNKDSYAKVLDDFYRKLENSHVTWITQPYPKGTGDALMKARKFAENEPIVVSAGDNLYLGKENIPAKLLQKYSKYSSSFLTGKRVKNPRKYGVIIYGSKVEENVYEVKGIVEKPENPPTNLINTSLYIFEPEIFKALKQIKPSPRGELEVTDAIQKLIEQDHQIYVYDAGNVPWIDIGTAETYIQALFYSIKHSNIEIKLTFQ